jgi:hypothetical protein
MQNQPIPETLLSMDLQFTAFYRKNLQILSISKKSHTPGANISLCDVLHIESREALLS